LHSTVTSKPYKPLRLTNNIKIKLELFEDAYKINIFPSISNKFQLDINKMKFIILLFISLFLNTGCTESEEDKVKDTCGHYIKGRMELKKGESALLKSVVSDSLYNLLILQHKYKEILRKEGVPIISANLNIHPVSVEIKGDCANCLMSGEEYYQINLCKVNGIWKVKGENGVFPTPERIAEAEQKLINERMLLENKPLSDSIIKIVNVFWGCAKNYFKTQNVAGLIEICSKTTIDLIQRLEVYSKIKIGSAELLIEMEKPDYSPGDVKRTDDKIIYTIFKEELTVLFQKENNTYKIIGFNGLESYKITNDVLDKQYLGVLRAMKIISRKYYRDKVLK
jgi:hypothetical protein